MTVGMSVQRTSTRLLPWVWGGRSTSLGAAAVAEDAPDDQALDRDEDRDRDREHDVVERADLLRLRRSRASAGTGPTPAAARRRRARRSRSGGRRRHRRRCASEAGRFLGLVDMTPRLRRRDRAPGAGTGAAGRERERPTLEGQPAAIIARGRWRAPCHHGAVPRRLAVLAVALAVGDRACRAGVVAAHGAIPAEPPSLATLAARLALRSADRRRAARGRRRLAAARAARRAGSIPGTRCPLARTAAFLGGLAAIAVALLSGIERYDTTLFSVHMVQHLLLMLVAAPLLALAAPVTQLLRAASPGARRRAGSCRCSTRRRSRRSAIRSSPG